LTRCIGRLTLAVVDLHDRKTQPVTQLCVAIFVTDPDQTRRDIALAAEAGADLVELRIDTFDGDVEALVKSATLPVIVTCRAEWEGGQSTATDEERLATLARVGTLAAYVDVELQTRRKNPFDRSPFGRLILSAHDFAGRPTRLNNLLTELTDSPADVCKVVWTARTVRDNLEAFEILQTRTKPTIALCMGEAGLISRVLAKKFGALLSFASLDNTGGTAPGQISIHDMKRLYRWDAISATTRVYGVVAQPVMHSMSPALHNAGFEAVDYDGVYLPFLVEGSYESFKAFMESFLHAPGLNLSGLSITLPHKENALRYLTEKGAEVEDLAKSIGAVNTIVIDSAIQGPESTIRNPSLRGFNTDYAAILDCITHALGIEREALKDYRVAVIGAGGTGRTAVAGLAHYGATVVVYNRTIERAEELAAEFNGRSGKVVAASMEKLCQSCCQIYINTTSVGMFPKVDASPFGDAPPDLTPDTLVFDTIYNPIETKLLQHARRFGAKTIGGVEMFVRQAAGQFEAWTGQPAPRDLMRRVIESRLQRAS